MAKKGLRAWVKEKWVDIGAPDGKGGYKPCGRSKGEKRKGYPKCVPLAKARSMSKGQKRSAVSRKRAKAQGVGGKPTNVKTFANRKKAADGGYIGSFIDLTYPEGKGTYKRTGNPSSKKYYKSLGII